ncbi:MULTISPECIES: hypothetical protein [Cysteiniphilum]|nr:MULTISPECIES: hypothetical protein [Cysteiniphilum]
MVEYIQELLRTFTGEKGNIDYTVFQLIDYVSMIMGFCLLFAALIRLSKHGKTQQMFRYYAPSTTILMFVAGVMLLSMSGFIEMVSNTLFSHIQFTPEGAGEYEYHLIDSVSGYADQVAKHQDPAQAQKYLIFALLGLIGFISLIRGMFLLIKVSEGQHDAGVGRVLSHMIAGIIGMNAPMCMAIISRVYADIPHMG